MKKSTKKLRYLTWMIITYLIMALVWWSVLLYTKNKEAFEAKAAIMQMEFTLSNNDNISIEQYEPYVKLVEKYQKQEHMIFGEGLLFILTLAIGIWLMNKGFVKEIKLAEQQKNFLLSITHELKSPLAGMKLALETLRKHQLDDTNKNTLLNHGLQDADRLENLISNLLLASRIDGGYQLHPEKIALNQLLDETIEFHRHRYPDTKFNITGDWNTELILDHAGIFTVFKNLFENAAKYNSGIPTINCHMETLEGNNVQINISDNGYGIPEHEHHLVFEKFYRIGSEDTRRTKGTGLGLYLVKGIIAAHKGNIKIENNKNGGTTFIITIPQK